MHCRQIALVAGLGTLLASYVAWAQDPASAPGRGEVVVRLRALVNGEPIFDQELQEMIGPEFATASAQQRYELTKRALDQLVEREVIYSEAKTKLKGREQVWTKLKEAAEKEFDRQMRRRRERFNIATDEEFLKLLEEKGISLDKQRRISERQFIGGEYMRSMIYPMIQKIGHGEMRQYYNEHPGEFQVEDRVTWLDLFVDAGKFPDRDSARRFAEDLAQRAASGEDFAALAKQFDDGDSKLRDGEGLGHRKGEIKPLEIEPQLFAMQEGQVGPVTEFPNGYHVFKLSQREYAGLRPFDEKTQSEIKQKLQGIIADREYKRILADLKRKASIQVIDAEP